MAVVPLYQLMQQPPSHREGHRRSAPSGPPSALNAKLGDNLNLDVSSQTRQEVDAVETKITYWELFAEGLRQISLVPHTLDVNSNLVMAVLRGHRFARLARLFAIAEQGSNYLRLDSATLKSVSEQVAHLGPLQKLGLQALRGMSRVLPFVSPLFAAWDVFKAVHEPNRGRRTTLVGNAALSVVSAVMSFELPFWSMAVSGIQALDGSTGQHLERFLGCTIRREWNRTHGGRGHGRHLREPSCTREQACERPSASRA